MDRSDRQEKILAGVLIVVSLFASWFFLLRPSLEEQGRLQDNLSGQEKLIAEPERWVKNSETEARRLSLRVIDSSDQEITVEGGLRPVLRLAQLAEDNGLRILLKRRGKTFTLNW